MESYSKQASRTTNYKGNFDDFNYIIFQFLFNIKDNIRNDKRKPRPGRKSVTIWKMRGLIVRLH